MNRKRKSNPGFGEARGAKENCTTNLAQKDVAANLPRELNGHTSLVRLNELLPDAVFLAIEAGSKAPIHKGWQKTNLDDSRRPEYKLRLESHTNTGVLLGEPSKGLCAIDFDTDETAELFLNHNPRLKKTMISRGMRGCQVWVYIDGDYPASGDLKDGFGKVCEWRGTGRQSVIRGIHPDGIQYKLLNETAPLRIRFEEIKWPDCWTFAQEKKPQTQADQCPAAVREAQEVGPELHKRITAYLDAIPRAVSGNGGHTQTLKVATELVHGWGLQRKIALQYLRTYNERCEPPWREQELTHKIDEALKISHLGEPGHLLKKTKQPDIVWRPGQEVKDTSSFTQRAIYPKNSLLADYMEYARDQTESADCYLIGGILPVAAAALARRVYLRWGGSRIYPNIFSMLAGKAGDRKTTAINESEKIARDILPHNGFLPENCSPEALFNEYDQTRGGLPDKILIVDDANALLTDWRKSSNGERVSTRFLRLYDCKDLRESFMRNRSGKSQRTLRVINETSTSVLLGATFNIACFQDQATRAGITRRFLFYVADGHGRMIVRPGLSDNSLLVRQFAFLTTIKGEIDFTPDAAARWERFQKENRRQLNATDTFDETEQSRLSSAPMQTLKIAILFASCTAAKQSQQCRLIDKETLQLAIDHVEACLQAARYLDTIADRETTRNEAESLVARIRTDFASQIQNGAIILTRSEITSKYAPHSDRKGARTPDDLYLRIIPYVISCGQAQRLAKEGKLEKYAFRASE
jgi:Bifunctional DNA primase/polymerase, N-terminal